MNLSRRFTRLDRASLPTPEHYLADHNLARARSGRRYAMIRCPVHDDATPSMSVSLADGHFKCWSCGAKGHDILALHRLRTGLGFVEAVLDLGGAFDAR